MSTSLDRDQWRQLSNGTWVPLRLDDDSPAAKEAISKVLGPPGTSILQPWRSPGGPRSILAAYELLRHELNALTVIIDGLLIGRHSRSYAGNIRLLNRGRARSMMGQVLLDPIVDEAHPLAPAMHLLQAIRGRTRAVTLNRSSFVLERNFEGDVSDGDRTFLELRERLGDGATATGPWLADARRTFAIQRDGTFFSKSGLFLFGSSAHAILRGGIFFLENGQPIVCLGPGVTSDDATGSSVAMLRGSGELVLIGDIYGNDIATSHLGDFTATRPSGAIAKITGGAFGLRELTAAQITALGTPAPGLGFLYVRQSDEHIIFRNDDGTDFDLCAAGAGTFVPLTSTLQTTHPLYIAGTAGVPVDLSAPRTIALAAAAANAVLAGPTSGGSSAPDFRLLVVADIPDLSALYAAVGHDHDHRYATHWHDHDNVYSRVGHSHDNVLDGLELELGDLITGDENGHAVKLAGNTTATKKFLAQTGTGTESDEPAWDAIAETDLPPVKRILETGGPTTLTFGAIPDQSTLFRDGAAVVGATLGDIAALVSVGDIECNQTSLTDVSQSYTLPADRLSADGESLKILVRGNHGNAVGLKVKIGGELVEFPGYASGFSPEASAVLDWQIELDVKRTSATELFVSGMYSTTGFDADVGSSPDRVILPGLEITLPGSGWAGTVLVEADYDTPGGTERVNLLQIRRVGFGSGGSGGGGGGSSGSGSRTSCSLTLSAPLTIPPNTLTTVKFNDAEEAWDTHTFHDGGAAAILAGTHGRITIPVGLGGLYLVSMRVAWDSTQTKGQRQIYVALNGSRVAGQTKAVEGVGTNDDWHAFSIPLELADGDYIEPVVYHAGPGNTDASVTFTATRMSA